MINDDHTDDRGLIRWRVGGKRVRGASHERSGLPCQDAVDWMEQPILLVVADGHGSERSFRSDIGAELAVEAAKTELNRLARLVPRIDLQALKHLADQDLPKAIVRRWWVLVAKDFGEPSGAHPLPSEILVRYGSTLLAVLVTEGFILYMQLGDGDILAVSSDGHTEVVFEHDERMIGNETTSLCLPYAWQEFQVRFQVLEGRPPVLILVSTDGYSNSFRTREDFHQIGPDYLECIRTDGFDTVISNYLEGWLIEASQRGSGDDITLGLIYLEEEKEENSDVSASQDRSDCPDQDYQPAL